MLTIEIESLDLAEQELPTIGTKELLDSYVDGTLLSYADLPSRMVNGKSHSFLQAMYFCYCDHRPFTLTPESIWLLVLQAFSVHINSDSKEFIRNYPRFVRRRKLQIRGDNINWNSTEECSDVVNEFCEKLDEEIGDGFVETLSRKFSSTTLDEEIVFQISTMNTVKSFFEFVVVTVICGIPKIHVAGNKEDWLAIVNRLEHLQKFNFTWFVENVIDVIKRIAREYDEKIQDDFWLNMFKVHTTEDYGNPKMVDGWITKFFPYKKNGERTDEDYFKTTPFEYLVKDINPQIVKLDFDHRIENSFGESLAEIPMLMIAGFVGIEQDEKTLSLKPSLGWGIGRKEEKLSEEVKKKKYDPLVFHRLEHFPNNLLEIEEIEELVLNFDNEIFIPNEIDQIRIQLLRLNGAISRREKRKIKEIYRSQQTYVFVNGEDINMTMYDTVKLMLKRISPFHQKYIDY